MISIIHGGLACGNISSAVCTEQEKTTLHRAQKVQGRVHCTVCTHVWPSIICKFPMKGTNIIVWTKLNVRICQSRKRDSPSCPCDSSSPFQPHLNERPTQMTGSFLLPDAAFDLQPSLPPFASSRANRARRKEGGTIRGRRWRTNKVQNKALSSIVRHVYSTLSCPHQLM